MINKKLNISSFFNIEKAYTEGVYADTPTNRKLGRVGMTYTAYNEKMKNSNEIIEKGSMINFNNLNKIANEIIKGTKRINSLNSEEEQGRRAGGKANVEASIITKAIKNSYRRGSGSESDAGDIKEQEIILEKYAKEKGIWYSNIDDLISEKLSSGFESDVYISKEKTHVIKITNPYIMNEDIDEFFDTHISLYNYIFPEAPYEVIGFIKNKNNVFSVIVRQPFIQGTILANKLNQFDTDLQEKVSTLKKRIYKDIDERIGNLDFHYSLQGNQYVNSDYTIEDVHFGNVIETKEGNFIYIDVIPTLNTKEDYTWGEREFGNGEIINNK